MKPILLSLAIFIFIAGCSATTDTKNRPTDAEGLYNLSCLACHGENLEGAAGPPVTNMADIYSEEDLHNLLMNGAGMMPGKLLTEEESRLVTKWLLEK